MVYDGVGADTFDASHGLAPASWSARQLRQRLGTRSPPFAPSLLSQKGSLFLTRPTLANYADTPERTRAMADELFEVLASGEVRVQVDQTYPLAEAARAHEDLEAGRTTGSTVLLP